MPRPVSERRKKLTGTAKKSRQRRSPKADPLPAAPLPPADAPEAVAAVWRELSPVFFAAGVLSDADLPAFRQVCARPLAVYRAAAAECLRDGFTSKGSEGQPRKSPTAALGVRVVGHVRRGFADFGMNPSSSRGVDAKPPQEEPNPFDYLMERTRRSR